MRYQITSDSTCDLSPDQLERYNIRLLPLYVSMDVSLKGTVFKTDIFPDVIVPVLSTQRVSTLASDSIEYIS